MATNISFPTYGFVNEILALSEDNWRTFFKPFITDSVQSGLATIAGANMTVYVSAGECRCGAVMGILDEMIALDIADGDSTYNRIDSVIVQYTYGEPSTLAVAIVQGVPSANPVPPTLTKVYDTLWQMEIAQILVPSGATSSSELTITDKRVIYESIESIIDDNTESEERIWSSQKTREEIVSLSTEIYDSLNTKADAITRTVSGNIVTITDGGDGMPVENLVVGIDPVQAGSGDPAPDNIRPISGHSTATVTRTGKNLLKISADNEGYKGGATYFTMSYSGNSATMTPTLVGSLNVVWDLFRIEEHHVGMKLYFNASITGGGVALVKSDTKDGTWSNAGTNIGNAGTTRTIVSDDVGRRYGVRFNNTTGNPQTVSDIMVNFGAASTFEPYQGTSVTIDLNGTRYGGMLNVLTGEMTVDRKKHTISANDAYGLQLLGDNAYRVGIRLPDGHLTGTDGIERSSIISNVAKYNSTIVSTGTFSSGLCSLYNWNTTLTALFSVPLEYNTASSALAYLVSIGADFVYPLATPLTVQLTPSQMQTLLGQNHIWSDTGDIINLTYLVDSKSFIDEQIAESQIKTRQMITIVTDQMIAPDNLNINDIVVVNDELYKVINSNIANGEAMVIGTNVIKITLAEYIQSLL